MHSSCRVVIGFALPYCSFKKCCKDHLDTVERELSKGSEWMGNLDLMRTISGLCFLLYRERNFMRTTNLFHGAMGIHLCANKETGYRAGWCVCGGLVVGGCVGGCMVCGSILHL